MSYSIITRLHLLASALLLFSTCTLSPPQTQAETGKLHQVGLVWLKNSGSKAERQKIIEAVHSFGCSIPEVKQVRVGRSDGIGGPFSDTSYDLCFILSFEDEAARQRYNAHPVHQAAARKVFLPLSKKLLFYRFVSE
ncbi:MAG: Dabb family protein [Verrucomicrobia bacterium]|nr:Dabb family protein [Verrucomicrobiota bacterium]